MAQFQIKIQDFLGGYAPSYWDNDYPSYGNKNMAGDMTDIDLSDPSYLQQGPGLSNLTNGTESGNVDTLIKGMLKGAYSSDVTYGIGGENLYKITSTDVPSDSDWPHDITDSGATSVEGEDVLKYQGDLIYTYNASSGADMGKYDGGFSDDWGSAHIGTGAGNLQADVPHQLIEGGIEDWFYVTNGSYVGTYKGDTDTFDADNLDLPNDCEVQSIAWGYGKAIVTANRSGVSASSNDVGSIFIWDGVSTNRWEREIRVGGKVGGTYVKDGVVYVFWDDPTSSAAKLGYVNGTQVKEVTYFEGSVPEYYQISDYKNFLIWASGGKIYAFGAADKQLSSLLFQLADTGYDTAGGISAPFSNTFVASTDGSSSYRLAEFSDYSTDSVWESLLFDIAGWDRHAYISRCTINTRDIPTGGQLDVSLVDSDGTTKDSASFTSGTKHIMKPQIYSEDIRVELDLTNSSTSTPVRVENIQIKGKTQN